MPFERDDEFTVLLVEDSQSFAVAIKAILEYSAHSPANVIIAETLAGAITLLTERVVDLVLLDLSLPDSHDLDSLIRLREYSPLVPVIVLTGLDNEAIAIEALKLGAQDYLQKGDINARMLNRAIAYARERSRRIALESERIRFFQEREDFMATLTHDLKNPLIGANRILALLGSDDVIITEEERRSLLSKLIESNNNLLSMIRNLIEVYRYQKDVHTLVRENTDLKTLVTGYLDGIFPLVSDKRIKIERQLSDQSQNIYADHNSLLRVVQNLIDNALKFTPEGGSISIKLWAECGQVMFQVSDSGPGISNSDKEKLFERFWQGNCGRAHLPGSGLGLYLCRQIVEAHHGKIWCDSEEEKGATFTVSLPTGPINDPFLSSAQC